MIRVAIASIAAAGLVPAIAYGAAGRWGEALIGVALAGAWVGGLRRRVAWAGSACFLGLVLLGGFGALSAVPSGWGLAGVVAALVAWDLSGFALVAQGAGKVVDEAALWRAHLRRLAAVAGGGLLLGGAALLVRAEIGFGWALLLGVVAVVALSRAIGSLRGS
jgi:hypothetical protein